MKLIIPMERDMYGLKLIAINVDREPVMDFRDEVIGDKEKRLMIELKGPYKGGEHTLELLLEKGVYRKYTFKV
ncbi:hypothetical protein GWK48_08325 [Metallosphaera tengchongensis]|uniref:Uncharacterized protein n=1 Tax=Metallosphaera tengchongensis TaxID=1532350 RepID=A0A6N0NVY3_9CREN|nr:hypothetical protein [Metallosphaera tengchongensis]QKR00377.1 hypothetical protein GWK48_08325 [Metallosphaera tengchongensis]